MGKFNVNVTEVAMNGIIGVVLCRRFGFSIDLQAVSLLVREFVSESVN